MSPLETEMKMTIPPIFHELPKIGYFEWYNRRCRVSNHLAQSHFVIYIVDPLNSPVRINKKVYSA